MAYESVFDRVNWENEPSVATPINQNNLNKSDSALKIIDGRVVAMDSRLTQLEGYEPRVMGYAQDAENSKNNSEAYATGTINGVDVTSSSLAYHNNSKWYSEQAGTAAAGAATSKQDSEAYAIGKVNGVDVTSSHFAFHNNAKWYSEQASGSATSASTSAGSASDSASDAEAYSAGTRQSSPVSSDDPAYHNNAKYYLEQAVAAATSAANSKDAAFLSEGHAHSSEIAAASSAYKASISATNAASSEHNASVSEGNAAISAASASSFASTADNRAVDSEAWAVGKRRGQDVSQSDETYHNNAKYWADQASQAAGGGVTSFNGRSQAVEPMEGDYTAAMVGLGNVDNTSDLNKPLSYAMSSALALKTPKSDIAHTEVSPSTHAYKQGDIFYYNGVLYKAKTAIAVDDVLTVGTNIETTTISATSGGHVIVDESGTSLTQRSKLKFIGDVTVTDDAVNDVTIVDVEGGGTIIVQKPTVVVGTYTYNGSPQGPTITWATGMADNCVISNATKTDAGTYTLTIALKNATKMVWDDMSVSDLTYNYTIDKATITLPAVTDTAKTYNGSEQSPTIAAYDTTKLTVSGNTATNAGDYTVVFSLIDSNNYQMSGTNNVAWSIAKANQTVTLSSNSVTLDAEHLTATVTVSGNVGSLSASTSDNTVATASISSSTVTVSNVNQKSGTATITVTAASTSNYNEGTVSISVTADFLQIVSFSSGTDAQIKAMLDAYYNDEITWAEMGWAVGDTRTIHFNEMDAPAPQASGSKWAAQDIVIVIVAHDHNNLATPINGHSKACITVQTRECMNNNTAEKDQNGHIYINGVNTWETTFHKWSQLYTESYLNDTIFNAISSSTFKSAIKPITHYIHTAYNTADDELCTDTVFEPSYPEMFGTASWQYYVPTTHTEGTQFPYYETTANRVKYGNNNGVANNTIQSYWTGSPLNDYVDRIGYYWITVDTTGSHNADAYSHAYALAPAWAM